MAYDPNEEGRCCRSVTDLDKWNEGEDFLILLEDTVFTTSGWDNDPGSNTTVFATRVATRQQLENFVHKNGLSGEPPRKIKYTVYPRQKPVSFKINISLAISA